MSQIRQYIRKQIQSFLLSGQIGVGDQMVGEKVFTNRIRQYDEKDLPCISVRTPSERAEVRDEATLSYKRSLQLEVVCIARADDAVDDLLDTIAHQVESILVSANVNNLFLDDAGTPYLNAVDYSGTTLHVDIAAHEIAAVVILFNIEYDSRHEPVLTNLEGFNITVTDSGTTELLYRDNLNTESV